MRHTAARATCVLATLGMLAAAGCAAGARPPLAAAGSIAASSGGSASQPAQSATVPALDGLPAVQFSAAKPPPVWPGPLPYPLIIADRGNSRLLEVTPDKRIVWQFPPAGGLPAGSQFSSGDDVFFTPSGQSVMTNEEHEGVIAQISYYTRRIIWSYGHYGVLRYGNGYLNYPDDAYRLPNGDTIVADIRNCRELIISPQGGILQQWGLEQDGGKGLCPSTLLPNELGSPNGDTPQPNGDVLLSLINGNWVALMSPQGKVLWDAKVPDLGTSYVSDAQLLPDGDVLTAGYGSPGRIVIFNPHTGKVDWLYAVASGPGALNHPSLALMLPNGNIVANDDYNDRIVVIDRQTKKIVWQYGVTGKAGTAAGYLNTPDGLDVDVFRNWSAWMTAHPGFGTPAAVAG